MTVSAFCASSDTFSGGKSSKNRYDLRISSTVGILPDGAFISKELIFFMIKSRRML
jgi:hypothetical protein